MIAKAKNRPSLANFRDISDMCSNILRTRRLYRSSHPQEATENDLVCLTESLDIRTLVDLRSPVERGTSGLGILGEHYRGQGRAWVNVPLGPAAGPGGAPSQDKIRCLWAYWKIIPLIWRLVSLFYLVFFCRPSWFGRVVRTQAARLGPRRTYRVLVDNYMSDVRHAVITLASSLEGRGGAAMVFCVRGRDRTGIVVALIQSYLGVPDDVIVRGYCGEGEDETPPDAMQSLLEHLRDRYGGAGPYLRKAGVPDSVLASLRHQLLR